MRLWPDKFRTDKFSPFGEQLESRRLLDGHLRSVVADSAHMVADVNTTFAPHITVSSAVQFEGKLHFLVADGIGDIELWSSDGTAEGTSRISEIAANSANEFFSPQVVAGELYFQLDRSFDRYDGLLSHNYLGNQELWKSDGTGDGTTFLTYLASTHDTQQIFTQYAEDEGRLFIDVKRCCHGSLSSLWSAAEPGGIPMKYDEFHLAFMDPVQHLTQIQNRWVFLGGDFRRNNNLGLWETEPGTGETRIIVGFEGDDFGGGPYGLTVLGDHALFVADGGQGLELWKTDGTTNGTHLVKDIVPGPESAAPRYLTPVPDGVLFQIRDTIWFSDGSTNGTKPLAETDSRSDWRPVQFAPIDGAPHYSRLSHHDITINDREIRNLTPYGDVVFFYEDSTLWISDGTSAGSRSLGDYYKLVGGLDDFVILARDRNLYQLELETLDITPMLEFPVVTHESDPARITASGDWVFFLGQHDGALWRTPIDTGSKWTMQHSTEKYAFTDEQFSSEYLQLAEMHTIGNNTYVAGANGLTVVDSRNLNTNLILDDSGDRWRTAVTSMTDDGDRLYFVRSMIDSDRKPVAEIWHSDGTLHGTYMIKGDIPNGESRYDVRAPQVIHTDGKLIFISGDSRLRVADLDGSILDLGVASIGSIAQFGDAVYFLRETHSIHPALSRQVELWKSDGTRDGTVLVEGIVDELVTSHSRRASELVGTNHNLFFGDGNGGLWSSDGTPQNAQLIYQFPPDDHTVMWLDSAVKELTPFGDKILFTVNDGIHGTELWESDGTTEGTQLAADVWPGFNGSRPTELTVLEDQIFFAANDGTHSRELWSIDIEVHEPLVGDADASGQVDFNDFLILSMNFGREIDATFEDGDFDDDGAVDFNDYLLLAANFERVVAS